MVKAKVAATIALEQRDEALKEKENAIIILNAAIVRYNRLKATYDAQVTLQNVENEQLNFKKETTSQTTILNSQVPISTTKENNKTVLSTAALPTTGYNHSVLSLVGLTTLGVLHSSIQRRRKRNKK